MSARSDGFLFAGGDPAGFCGLAAASQRQSSGGNVFGNAGASSNVSAVADGDWGDQGGVGTDENAVADGGLVLVDAVVITGDGASADVDVCSDVGVAEVVEVVRLGGATEANILGLNEVANVSVFADVTGWAKVRVRAEDGVAAYHGLVKDAAVADEDAVAEGRVLDDRVGTDAAIGTDAGVAEELDVRLDGGVRADFHGGINDGGFGAEDRDATCHELASIGETYGCIEVHHLGDGVGTEDLVDTMGFDGDDALAFGDEHGGDIGEVELAVGVVGVEGVELGEESCGLESVDAGVDLGCAELVGAERFLLDDGGDFGAVC